MVAYLLELGQRGEDQAASPDSLRAGERGFRVLEHGGIQRSLLAGERAIDFHFELVRQIGDDGLVGLEPAQDERTAGFLQALARGRVAQCLDGNEVAPLEFRLRAEQAGIEEVHDRPEVAHVVLDRRPGKGDPKIRRERTGGTRLPALRILHVLRFVEHESSPADPLQQLEVAREERVAGDDQAAIVGGKGELIALPAREAVVHVHRKPGREAHGFLLPVGNYGSRADQQHGADALCRARMLQQRQGLHRLAKPHVVGQTSAKAEALQESKPGKAARLVRSQCSAKARRRG